ncbi:Plasmodium exported protein (Pm-fam-a like), unknown function [Plasmodium malariae]|uniref:Fam-m protein n=1 Tax=Plasmodium malariae TaxID=5858 RepID=A0A1A8X8K1_PLAMA|nr:Plasmodium exported protein (Pm-fam-a like), unknown function [Plasmodium malariae]
MKEKKSFPIIIDVASGFSEYTNENCYLDKISDTRNYRLLVKYNLDNSNKVCLKEKFRNNGVNEKKDIYNNKKGTKKKNKYSSRNLLNKEKFYTEVIDYNNGMFDGKHFHFEKKWIKKRNYDDFVEKKRRICDISLKKIKFRSYGFGIVLFFFFFLFGIGIPLSPSFLSLLYATAQEFKSSALGQFCMNVLKKLSINIKDLPYLFIVLFVVFMVMLSVMLIISVYKILRNNEKYNKINLMKEYNE